MKDKEFFLIIFMLAFLNWRMLQKGQQQYIYSNQIFSK